MDVRRLEYELRHLVEDRRNAEARIEREKFQIDKVNRRIAELEERIAVLRAAPTGGESPQEAVA